MNHLTVTAFPDPILTEVRKHDQHEAAHGTTEITVIVVPVAIRGRLEIMFDTPALAQAWLDRCCELIAAATDTGVKP